MMMFKSTKVNTVFFLGMLLLVLASCDKKEERTYELLPPSPIEQVDMTDLGVLSVNVENEGGRNAGEGSPKVVDNDLGSKYLTNPYRDTMWIELNLLASQAIDAYELTSGNDAVSRDPKNWTLRGSKDRITWVDVDTRVDQVFTDRKKTNRYEFTNTELYKYYRLYITKHNGDQRFQLAEFRIFGKPQS